MNKADLIGKFSEETGSTKVAAKGLIETLLSIISDGLKTEGKVTIPGFGVFAVSDRKERNGVNPKTGEKIKIPASKGIKFRASKDLKDIL